MIRSSIRARQIADQTAQQRELETT